MYSDVLYVLNVFVCSFVMIEGLCIQKSREHEESCSIENNNTNTNTNNNNDNHNNGPRNNNKDAYKQQ
jgi:hypothetical protein